MKFFGLDKREYNINFENYRNKTRGIVSSGHERARNLLHEIYPNYDILEEVAIPGTGGRKIFADFFIPRPRIVVEVHGEQHYKYIHHFHKTLQNFRDSKKRDALKQKWCYMNNIEYIELSDKDSDEEWRRKIVEF